MKAATGFADAQLTNDQFRINFQGNAQTSSEEVSDYALLRAAQVTLAHSFGYFAVTDVTNTSSAREYFARQRFHTDSPPNMLGPPTRGAFAPYESGYTVEYQQPAIYFRPGTSLLIKCFRSKPATLFTYDASMVERLLKRKYKLR